MGRINIRKIAAACLTSAFVVSMAACGGAKDSDQVMVQSEKDEKRVVNLFSPMEKTDPDAENTARNAADLTVMMAEEALGLSLAYRT